MYFFTKPALSLSADGFKHEPITVRDDIALAFWVKAAIGTQVEDYFRHLQLVLREKVASSALSMRTDFKP